MVRTQAAKILSSYCETEVRHHCVKLLRSMLLFIWFVLGAMGLMSRRRHGDVAVSEIAMIWYFQFLQGVGHY
jgi:hypothetical protein